MRVFQRGDALQFPYTNYRGEHAVRRVIFIGLQYGSNEYYPDEQFFFYTFDLDKVAYRSYALDKIAMSEVVYQGNLGKLLKL